jgi:hypothetical protein
MQMLQDLVERYRKKHKATSVNLRDVAAWAVREREYEPEQRSTIKVLARDLAAALREVYIVDPQGRRVRQKHAERVWREVHEGKQEQLVLWHDITEATRPQMQAAFQQRRHGIVMDCRQLKCDVDSYNENYNKAVPIQMWFDFREDLEDAAHASQSGD